jgi:two-component system chemotaxis response regulator CheB
VRPSLPAVIEVLVVDDSAVVRQLLTTLLTSESGIHVTTASDPVVAMAKMRRRRPHVILLDLEMPRMDGLTFLRQIMATDPLPVVVCSGFAEPGTGLAMRALSAGAVDIMPKPRLPVAGAVDPTALLDVVRAAAMARVGPPRIQRTITLPGLMPAKAAPPPAGGAPVPARTTGVHRVPTPAPARTTGVHRVPTPAPARTTSVQRVPTGAQGVPTAAQRVPTGPHRITTGVHRVPTGTNGVTTGVHRVTTEAIVAIGASTGGTEALRDILRAMPADAPGIVIVQHMPAGFTAAFAEHLNGICRIEVREAAPGDRVIRGRALIARGDRHLLVKRHGFDVVCELSDAAPVSRHRPSVDVLFRSIAEAVGPRAVGVILTGMGADGAEGLLAMKQAGASTIAQDESTSVVFGMPKEAIDRGAVDVVLPLPRIAAGILQRVPAVTGSRPAEAGRS